MEQVHYNCNSGAIGWMATNATLTSSVGTAASQIYTINITIAGSVYRMIVDTGSSDTWVRGLNCLAPINDTSCTGPGVDPLNPLLTPTGKSFEIHYGDGSTVSGPIFNTAISMDGLPVGQNATIQNAFTIESIPIGVTTSEIGLGNQFDGIIGLAFNSISNISRALGGVNANFFDLVHADGWQGFTMYLAHNVTGSVMQFGQVDGSLFAGTSLWVPITNAHGFWEIDFIGSTYNVNTASASLVNTSTFGFVDSGTNLIVLDQVPADAINLAIGSTAPNGLLIPCSVAATGYNVKLNFGGQRLSIPASQYVLPYGNGSCYTGFTAGIL
jgi:hypothetical protein